MEGSWLLIGSQCQLLQVEQSLLLVELRLCILFDTVDHIQSSLCSRVFVPLG